jgi:hypothetical protein
VTWGGVAPEREHVWWRRTTAYETDESPSRDRACRCSGCRCIHGRRFACAGPNRGQIAGGWAAAGADGFRHSRGLRAFDGSDDRRRERWGRPRAQRADHRGGTRHLRAGCNADRWARHDRHAGFGRDALPHVELARAQPVGKLRTGGLFSDDREVGPRHDAGRHVSGMPALSRRGALGRNHARSRLVPQRQSPGRRPRGYSCDARGRDSRALLIRLLPGPAADRTDESRRSRHAEQRMEGLLRRRIAHARRCVARHRRVEQHDGYGGDDQRVPNRAQTRPAAHHSRHAAEQGPDLEARGGRHARQGPPSRARYECAPERYCAVGRSRVAGERVAIHRTASRTSGRSSPAG